MNRIKGILFLFALVLPLLFFVGEVKASVKKIVNVFQEKEALPATLDTELDSLKEENDLTNWLDTWYDYLATDPTGHYNELQIPINTVWRQPEKETEEISWFYLLIFVGYYELQQGNILNSIDTYETAYEFTRRVKSINPEEILEYLIKPLGNNYTRLGDFERALYLQKQGLELAKKESTVDQQVSLLANLSTTARWNERLDEALDFSNQALQLADKNTAMSGLLYSTRADILQQLSQTKDASVSVEKALNIFRQKPLKKNENVGYWYSGALVTAGDLYMDGNQFRLGIQSYQQALNILNQYFPESKFREKTKIKVALGNANSLSGNNSTSLRFFNDALRDLIPSFDKETIWPKRESLYAENTLLDAILGKSELLYQLREDSMALEGYQKAALVVNELRKTIFSTEAKRLLQKQGLEATEKAVGLAYQLYKKTGNDHYPEVGLHLVEQNKARLLLDDLQKNIQFSSLDSTNGFLKRQSQLNQATAFYTHAYIEAKQRNDEKEAGFNLQKMKEVEYELSLLNKKIKAQLPEVQQVDLSPLSEMLSNVPEGVLIWEYFTGEENWYGFGVSQAGVVEFKKLGTADTLTAQTDHYVKSWFESGPSAMVNAPRDFFENSFQLYRSLKINTTDSYENLLIVPDGVLGSVPFEALLTENEYHPNPQNWPYFLKKLPTSQSYSISIWNQLRSRKGKISFPHPFSGFFVSPEETDPLLAELNGVEEERNILKRMLVGDFFNQRRATAANVLKAVQKSEVIHLSTHAFLLDEDQIPAIQMSDGKVLLTDLYPLSIHPSLVVLSACQTANGLFVPGEGMISLAREFIASGAGGVVAGLWEINDETVAQLTGDFYRYLMKTGRKTESLYEAKLDWLMNNQRDAVLKLPYYWAGMVYYGDYQPLTHPLKKASLWHRLQLKWIMVALMLLLGVWKLRKSIPYKHEKTIHI